MKRKILALLAVFLCVFACSCTETANPAETLGYGDTEANLTDTQSNTASDTETQPVDTDSEAEPDLPATEEKVNIVMVGDILMHDPILQYGKTEDGYSFDHLFENVKGDIEKADIAMLNQEVIIAGEKYGIQGYPRFNSPFELADAIADAGFDVACHATNHTLDCGADAMRACLEYWETEHPDITVIGMQDNSADASSICIIEKNGIKIAMLNYTYYAINYAGEPAIKKEPYLVNRLIEDEVRADIAAAEEYADFTVVSVHWGDEYSHTPSSEQRAWASVFLEGGVDLVLGTHPHVLQPVEWLEGTDGDKMLVYWSLGNFVNSTAEEGSGIGDRMLGAMADVTVERGVDGKVRITEAKAIPLITHIEFKKFGITTYKFSDYTEAQLSQSEAVKKDAALTFDYAEKHFSDMLGSFIALP